MGTLPEWINVGILLTLFGMAIGFGRWAVLKLWDIEKKLDVACGKIPPLERCAERNDSRLDKLEVAFAGHFATPHCGEEKEKTS
jgi:hypothetical protein